MVARVQEAIMHPEAYPPVVTAEVALHSDDWQLQCRLTVPAGPARLSDLLPLARALADAIVRETSQYLEQAGEPVSCQAGCGACCRHLVALSEVEARRLNHVIDALPEPRRSAVRARFADAQGRLADAGLLPALQHAEQLSDAAYRSLATAYFAQHLACPFLEDESCTIYQERPIACREYLVTSPAAACAQPTADAIRRVQIPLPVFNAVARWQVTPAEHVLERWVPLILAPDWAAAHPEDPPPQPGVALLRELLDHLTGKSLPDQESDTTTAL
jgi:Fe-S-cluster containining protein